jgi:hypothetical protein
VSQLNNETFANGNLRELYIHRKSTLDLMTPPRATGTPDRSRAVGARVELQRGAVQQEERIDTVNCEVPVDKACSVTTLRRVEDTISP